MKSSLGLAAALFPVFVNSGAPPSININVQVAPGGQLVYSPSNFAATNGTNVTFNFPESSTLHSVTQGFFEQPCVYLAASGGNPAGFDSGLQSGKQFTLEVTNDNEPVFFFCKAPGHCPLGMVGAINAPATGKTYAAYLAAAKALGSNGTPSKSMAPSPSTSMAPSSSTSKAPSSPTPISSKSMAPSSSISMASSPSKSMASSSSIPIASSPSKSMAPSSSISMASSPSKSMAPSSSISMAFSPSKSMAPNSPISMASSPSKSMSPSSPKSEAPSLSNSAAANTSQSKAAATPQSMAPASQPKISNTPPPYTPKPSVLGSLKP